MAKFRRSHSTQSKKSGSRGFRFILLLGVLLSLLFFLLTSLPKFTQQQKNEEAYQPKYQDPATELRSNLPTTRSGTIVHHRHYSLSYSEEHEQAEWVAYKLTRDMLNGPRVPRTDWFEEDPAVLSKSAHFEDYRSSGFTKGHLAPAADMAFSQEAMDETFLMSNISPQDRAFNNGIWRELEESSRDWARKHGHLYIVTGPVLENLFSQKLGRNQVSVPSAFYKVLLHDSFESSKGIGFIIPNTLSERPLSDYMVSIDEVEEVTDLDFFKNILTPSREEHIESTFNTREWPIDLSRYDRRINNWNKHGNE